MMLEFALSKFLFNSIEFMFMNDHLIYLSGIEQITDIFEETFLFNLGIGKEKGRMKISGSGAS